VFTYSHEENTHAYILADDISQEEKQRRSDAVMESQMSISEAFNQSLKGQTVKVLFDRLEGDEFVGRTEYDSPEVDNEVRVPAKDNYVRMGDFANVKITDASTYDLFGEVVKS
jgi:ribosomal protein S12 methylthiotransferase